MGGEANLDTTDIYAFEGDFVNSRLYVGGTTSDTSIVSNANTPILIGVDIPSPDAVTFLFRNQFS